MNAPSTDQTTQEDAQPGNTDAQAGKRRGKPGTPFTSETAKKAREARTRKEREGAARAERDAELDKLTVRARLATTGATELTTSNLREVWQGLLALAKGASSEHARVQASKLVLDLARQAVEDDGGKEPEGVVWADRTPAQRAAAIAALDRHIIAVAAEAETGEGAPGGGTPADDDQEAHS